MGYDLVKRTYNDDLTLYEQEVKAACIKIREADTVEQAIEIFLSHLREQEKKCKII